MFPERGRTIGTGVREAGKAGLEGRFYWHLARRGIPWVVALLQLKDISKTLGLQHLFTGVNLTIDPGERMGLIGPNGAGKSTLLKIIAGIFEPDEGEVLLTKGVRAIYVPQHDVFPDGATARQVVHTAALRASGVDESHEAEVLADAVLERLGFDAAHTDVPAMSLSGGWRKRLSIAAGLAACKNEPDLLLLDEPTNHLDLDGIAWLEELLKSRDNGVGFASIFVTHDRAFLESVANRIVELSQVYADGTLAVAGNYSEFLRRKQERLDGQAKAEQALANQVRKDLAWLARGPQARRTKSKSRIESSHERIDAVEELRSRNAMASVAGAKVDFVATGRKTKKFISAKGVSKSFGERCLFKDVSIDLGAGDVLGLLGPNGSGKTTLLRVLTGELAPDSGTVDQSEPKPRVVVFSQHRQDFPPTTLLSEALCPVSDVVRYRGSPMHITAWSRRFLFRDAQLQQPISSLSGGELARVHIARIMLEPADVLVLDEPTNDLDIPTLETLEEALEEFPGALILVTHDRAMLDRLATEVLVLNGEGKGWNHTAASVEQALRAVADHSKASAAPVKKAASPQESAPIAQSVSAARRRLSYKEQRELETMEENIQKAEAVVARCAAAMSEPGLSDDHKRMAKACKDLSDAEGEVARLYARWAELEELMGGLKQ